MTGHVRQRGVKRVMKDVTVKKVSTLENSYWLLELVSSIFMETESVKNGTRNAYFFRFWSSSVVEVFKSR